MSLATAGGGSKINFNTTLCVINFVLGIVAAWALKRVNPAARFSTYYYSVLLLHSVLSVLRITYPAGRSSGSGHPHATATSRVASSTFYAQLLLLLVIADALHIIKQFEQVRFYYYVAGGVAMMAVALHMWGFNAQSIWLSSCISTSVLCNTALLAYVIYAVDECYWTCGLMSLVVLNHFVLQNLALHYDISQLEISTLGLCFIAVFALNATEELIGTVKEANINGASSERMFTKVA